MREEGISPSPIVFKWNRKSSKKKTQTLLGFFPPPPLFSISFCDNHAPAVAIHPATYAVALKDWWLLVFRWFFLP